jgi:phosphatidylserine/phosphatidylglycerophosphate/cardiolipin synthase-like enzyme
MNRSMVEAKEDSILLGYLRAIRCSTKFVYLESEFFISGSLKWRKRRPGMVINTIAEALADQIRSKGIRVYIVVPLYPECSPDGPLAFPFGDLINVQIRTMEMLHREVALACQDKKPENHIQLCAVGRTHFLSKARYPVYVHSKLFVVDDQFVIVGSANINDRSLCGYRDVEICVGLTHPTEIADFRKKCWRSLMTVEVATLDPSLESTLLAVRAEAEVNWELFCSFAEMRSPMMQYPAIWNEKEKILDMRLVPQGNGKLVQFPNGSLSQRGQFTSFLLA